MVNRQGTKNFRKLWIFGSGHFLIYFLRYYGSKNDRIQKNFFIQKSVFSCLLTRRNDFWNPFILRSYFHNCLPGLLSHIANQLSLLTKKYLTSKVHFDIIYLKITENARSVTTENTLLHRRFLISRNLADKCGKIMCFSSLTPLWLVRSCLATSPS